MGKYGHDRPLSISASIGFEQTYSEVDGDSASSTELYRLLSALTGLPIKQGVAVTGSVNQVGEVQAIGGATHKIEGFYQVCKAKGLTGEQGVILPRDNIRNLVLDDEVVGAVSKGKFHIFAVSTIDEGIEVLTGTPAGERGEDGEYPEGTVHHLVEQRLEEMAKAARDMGRPPTTTTMTHMLKNRSLTRPIPRTRPRWTDTRPQSDQESFRPPPCPYVGSGRPWDKDRALPVCAPHSHQPWVERRSSCQRGQACSARDGSSPAALGETE